MYLSNHEIESLPRIKRLNLINSVSGIKAANLIGTKSKNGKSNVAIFSSLVHLGSHPALLGFFLRPQDQNPRDTYLNLKETARYTINQINTSMIERAHYTSAKFPEDVSEFERCNLGEEYLFDFEAPFVKESRLKMGMEMVEEIPIKSNGTLLIVVKILHLTFEDEMMEEEGYLNLEQTNTVGIGGLNSYYDLKRIGHFPYAHVQDVPEFPRE